MIDDDDTHLCIKCSITIEGLDNYIAHRKRNCLPLHHHHLHHHPHHPEHDHHDHGEDNHKSSTSDGIISTAEDTSNLDQSFESFAFVVPETPVTEHGGKSSKSLDYAILPYELGADVFFSSLQLQSVQSSAPSTSGKTGNVAHHQQHVEQQLDHQTQLSHRSKNGVVETWSLDTYPSTSGQHTSNLAETPNSTYEVIFDPISYDNESSELSEEEEGDVEEDENNGEEEDVDFEEDNDDDDADYDPIASEHASGGKWKPAEQHEAPLMHLTIDRLSPHLFDAPEEVETLEAEAEAEAAAMTSEHPPAGHTKGKWVPGTKLQRLEYKQEVNVVETQKETYRCNICSRTLKTKTLYENHLNTRYHLSRVEPEEHLERAALQRLPSKVLRRSFATKAKEEAAAAGLRTKKRRHLSKLIRCETCKMSVARLMIGKHLISHYHYRRMLLKPAQSLPMIYTHIHSVVLQSPFQCATCCYYFNTEAAFLEHWTTREHRDAVDQLPGVFCCNFCCFECEENDEMSRHLHGSEHREVVLAINRSIPIVISKKRIIGCQKCNVTFRYNVELRAHVLLCHPGAELVGTVSDEYQSRFRCTECNEWFGSRINRQRHEKNKHSISKFFCSICNMEFATACQARHHRKTLLHRQTALATDAPIKETANDGNESVKANAKLKRRATNTKKSLSATKPRAEKRAKTGKRNREEIFKCKDCDAAFESSAELQTHLAEQHQHGGYVCLSCGEHFMRPQMLGRHSQNCKPKMANAESTTSSATVGLPPQSKKCEECAFSTQYESDLIFHRLFHVHGVLSSKQRIKCPLCWREFGKNSLRCHLRTHTNEKIFECKICDLKFTRRHNLKDHIKNVHTLKAASRAENIQHRCNICSKVFALKSSLKAHAMTHQRPTQRLIKCRHEGCQFSTFKMSGLRIHMEMHSTKSYCCEQPDCTYVGKSQLHLKRHWKLHSAPTKLYHCDECEYSARNQGHLRRHQLSHTKTKPFKCRYCDFCCSSFDNLRKHVLKTGKHPGRHMYECDHCAQVDPTQNQSATAFKTNSHREYQLHLRTKHSEETTETAQE